MVILKNLLDHSNFIILLNKHNFFRNVKISYSRLIIFVIIVTMVYACSRLEPAARHKEDTLDGAIDALTYGQHAQHLAGDDAFNEQVFTNGTGLGPLFVATSCGSCHAGDGKGHPFTTLIRFGQVDSTGNHFLSLGGPQLQNRAIPGYMPEQIPAGTAFSKFTPPINSGLGFLELVPDEDILAMAAANSNNPDGVRGHPNWNYVPGYIEPRAGATTINGKYIGRFGKKAAVYNLLQQTVGAYNQDIGITSTYDEYDTYSLQAIDPELTNKTVLDVVFYLQTLKAPVQRNANDPEVVKGKTLFIQSGCETCHKQTLKTGYSSIEPLSNKEFHPYTDLLVHDTGPGLDDGYTEGNAKTAEWRTPPLWGLGLSPDSQGGQFYLLHDGRAHSIEEAIELHEGEATVSKNNFMNLSPEDRAALVKFLKSL